MLGNKVNITGTPIGHGFEGIVSGTPKPGTVMQLAAATEPVQGDYTWEVFNADADGDRRLIAILLERGEGYTWETAYETGHKAFLYIPLPGDEFNMLVRAAGTATSDAQAIGDLYIVDDATGLLVATTGDPESEPFVCMETLTDVVTAGTMVHVMYTGH